LKYCSLTAGHVNIMRSKKSKR